MDGSKICVRGLEDNTVVEVEPEVWTNAHYVIDKESKEIREEIEGEFRQYPLRLAWAITIHKSQGQTYRRTCVDPACFDIGQLYVALSRCESIEGLSLMRPAYPGALRSSPEVIDFYNSLDC